MSMIQPLQEVPKPREAGFSRVQRFEQTRSLSRTRPTLRSDQRDYRLMFLLIGLATLSGTALVWQAISPQPFRFAGLLIDRMSAVCTLLVASVGSVTYRFSLRYLDGDPHRGRFLRRLCFTASMAFVLMLSDNLIVLFVSWSLTSLGLHLLLLHDPTRSEAQRPARKKFLISRIGDIALILAILLIRTGWGTYDLSQFLSEVRAENDLATASVAFLVVLAALTKSAQFPFHSWLPETMEAPTPVSALMHAGIINAGGVLLLRFSPLILRVPLALLVLSLIGTVTVVIGMLSMWAQVKAKRTLAWSTVSQMGFMMVQCGLGAFPAAGLHIVGHGLYKAWSFLRTGDLPQVKPISRTTDANRGAWLLAVGTLASLPALAFASGLTGFSPLHSPGETALAAIVALSVGQLWVAIYRDRSTTWSACLERAFGATLTTIAATLAAFGLYRGATLFLEPVLGVMTPATGPIAWITAILPVAASVGLCVVHLYLQKSGHSRAGRAFYVHALNGFYFGTIADRFVDIVWNNKILKGVKGA